MARTAPIPNIPAIPGMCPGLAVLGGGAGSGGGSGKGVGKGGGEEGAGGEGGADATNGDGRGGGNCGPGSPGSCNNCGSNTSAGDPVDVVSGKVYTVPKRDLYLPGLFNLEIVRSYCSAARKTDIGMGWGWRHSLGWSITRRRRGLTVRSGDGKTVQLPKLEVGQLCDVGGWQVIRGEEFIAVRPGNEFEHYFGPHTPGGDDYRLEFVRYRNRGQIVLQYDGSRLARVIDSVGRVVLLHHNAQGRISSLAVPDTQGRSIVFARYAYDDEGNLAGATDADGHTTYYSYDDEHRLVRMEYPNGVAFHFVYDSRGRCVETWGDIAGRVDPALAPGLDETLADGRTPAKGIYHCRLSFEEDFSEVADSMGARRFMFGVDGQVAKAITARGGVTTREFDERGRVAGQTDANGATWRWQYDAHDNIVHEQDPDGGVVAVRYDTAGNPVEMTDPAGETLTVERDSQGEITRVTDPAGAAHRFELDPRGLILRETDPRGGIHVYEYDAHANRIGHTFPNGSKVNRVYDYWGRLVREVNPLGEEQRFTSADSGRVTSRTDAAGRTWSFEYDGMGNVTSSTRPDGHGTELRWGGLGWLYLIREPDGSELQAGYNREGRMVFMTNERGERYEFAHTPDGIVNWEKNFHGHETTFGYDFLGRLAWFDDGTGKTEFTRSPGGILLSQEAPDGSMREYTYNMRGHLVSALSDGIGLVWDRGPVGELMRETVQVGGTSYTVSSTRNAAGDRDELSSSLGFQMLARRDANGRVSELWSAQQRVLAIERDAVSRPIRRCLAAGGVIEDNYDRSGKLRSRKLVGSGSASGSVGEPQWVGRGAPGSHERYFDYDPIGELMQTSSSDGDDVVYEYDIRRRLKKVKRDELDEAFDYDATSNAYESGAGVPPRQYAAGNQLSARGNTQYFHDDRGFLVEKRDGEGGVTRYSYNAWRQLERVELPDCTVVEFDYDPFARRLAKRVLRNRRVIKQHHYVWDRLSLLHDVELDAAGSQQAITTYLFEEHDQSIPLGHQRDGAWHYYLHEPNGAPQDVVDGAGGLLLSMRRGAFGRVPTNGNSAASTDVRFWGQRADEETGLHYNRYRYYDPDTGRFTSPDPIGLDGGPNLYGYAPNPIGWADPMGWSHVMNHHGPSEVPGASSDTQSSTHGDSGRYESGWANGNPCPSLLRDNGTDRSLANRANCHTEQKFAADLLASHRADNDHSNDTHNLSGSLPPCPTCHTALRRAAAETGANISYSFGDPPNRISYNGGSAGGNPLAVAADASDYSGADAGRLASGGYTGGRTNSRSTWGYSPGSGASSTYSSVRSSYP